MGGNAMTSRPAAPESEKKIAPGDALLEAYKLAERVIKPSSMYGATAQQLASALLTNKEITTEFAEEYETVKRRLSLAQTEIKGHMRVKDDLQARVAELEKALRHAANALYNDFEPDNQSRAYHAADAALKDRA